jgi:hypothetical protein
VNSQGTSWFPQSLERENKERIRKIGIIKGEINFVVGVNLLVVCSAPAMFKPAKPCPTGSVKTSANEHIS